MLIFSLSSIDLCLLFPPNEILYPKFLEAIDSKKILTVDLDGGYGYGSSFLEESFGGLVRKLKKEKNENYKRV